VEALGCGEGNTLKDRWNKFVEETGAAWKALPVFSISFY
jgi:hypothetical protein